MNHRHVTSLKILFFETFFRMINGSNNFSFGAVPTIRLLQIDSFQVERLKISHGAERPPDI